MVKKVLCCGCAVWDTIMRVSEVPSPDTKIMATGCAQVGEGMASAAAAAIAKLGAEAHIWSRVGDDVAGKAYLEDMAAAGVHTSEVRVTTSPTATSTIIVSPAGRLVVPYYDPAMDPDTSWLPLSKVQDFDAVLVDPRWPEAALAVLRKAGECNIPAVLDADVAPLDILLELIPHASHVVFSRQALLTTTGATQLEDALLRAVKQYPHAFIGVTCGEAGFYHVEGGAVLNVPSPTINCVDTLAAGDVWHGAFTLALAELQGIEQAANFACYAAAIKCTHFGGRRGAPTRDEIAAWQHLGPSVAQPPGHPALMK